MYVPLPSQSPYPIIVYSVANQLQTPSQPLLGKYVIFRDPKLGTLYFYELTHFLEYRTLHFSSTVLVCLLTVNMKNCLTSKNPKMCHPILVTLLKMRPHYSQSSRENATPSSGTSPVASYKEVPPGINNSLVARKQIPPLLLFQNKYCICIIIIPRLNPVHLKPRQPPVRECA